MSNNSSTTPTDQQTQKEPATSTFFSIPGDSGNKLRPAGSSSLDLNPYQLETQLAAGDQAAGASDTWTSGLWGAVSDGATSFWSSSWRNWTLVGIGAGVAIGLIVSALTGGGSAKSMTLPSQMTPVQALQAQQLIQKQLANADQALRKAGISAASIQQAHQEAQVIEGTQVVLASRSSDGSVALPKKVTVSGVTTPSHYSSLAQLDAKAYVATLSPVPTLSDLTDNSAVLHGVKADNQ